MHKLKEVCDFIPVLGGLADCASGAVGIQMHVNSWNQSHLIAEQILTNDLSNDMHTHGTSCQYCRLFMEVSRVYVKATVKHVRMNLRGALTHCLLTFDIANDALL